LDLWVGFNKETSNPRPQACFFMASSLLEQVAPPLRHKKSRIICGLFS